MAVGDRGRGLYTKYKIRNIETDEPVQNGFVLRPEQDAFARAALRTYAERCAEEYPRLAEDIRHWLESLETFGTEDKRG